jgi:hypothetical protein
MGLEDGPARALREALVRRLSLHRPSAAIVISLIALFVAMSGTAVAATGGSFILGKPNTATTVTSLSNTKGTALSLSSTSTTPPMTVSNSVQVPKLNASELGGHPASAFLGVNGTAANSSELGGKPPTAFLPEGGTAANSSELGGQPASDYMTGTGQIASDTATVASGTGADVTVPSSVSNDYGLQLQCISDTAEIGISATGATLQYWVLPPDGQPELSGVLPLETTAGLAGTTSAATWVVQVAFGSTMATTDWSATVNTNGTCTFAAQTISNG